MVINSAQSERKREIIITIANNRSWNLKMENGNPVYKKSCASQTLT